MTQPRAPQSVQKQPAPKKPTSGVLNLIVDYGPVAVFFAIYKHYSPAGQSSAVGEVFAVMRGTVAFMIAAVVALAVSRWKLGKISPMLWLSTGLIVVFGGLTVFFQDKNWIQIKPTVIYLLFGTALLLGVARGQSVLKYLLEAAFEGLSETGWMKLSRNWGVYFFFLAGLNEVLRHQLTFGDWIAAKLWLFMPLTFLFTFAHIPMLLRHGLAQSAETDVLSDPPHE
ncbi:MAG: hypothetical protein RIQ99_1114 [Pseudomonadota bacterium]|jgi:intracellular septation protein